MQTKRTKGPVVCGSVKLDEGNSFDVIKRTDSARAVASDRKWASFTRDSYNAVPTTTCDEQLLLKLQPVGIVSIPCRVTLPGSGVDRVSDVKVYWKLEVCRAGPSRSPNPTVHRIVARLGLDAVYSIINCSFSTTKLLRMSVNQVLTGAGLLSPLSIDPDTVQPCHFERRWASLVGIAHELEQVTQFNLSQAACLQVTPSCILSKSSSRNTGVNLNLRQH